MDSVDTCFGGSSTFIPQVLAHSRLEAIIIALDMESATPPILLAAEWVSSEEGDRCAGIEGHRLMSP